MLAGAGTYLEVTYLGIRPEYSHALYFGHRVRGVLFWLTPTISMHFGRDPAEKLGALRWDNRSLNVAT